MCQAAYGVFDRHNTLRGALAESLAAAQCGLYARWATWERLQAARLHYAPSEAQLRAEWARLAAAAARPGAALQQLHVWALAHVLRRPLLVYGEDVVSSFRGDALGYARFRGLYLPLLCDEQQCSKAPLALAYTRGHFSALVPLDPAPPYIRPADAPPATAFLPLTDLDGKLLPVHFLTCEEVRPRSSLSSFYLHTQPGMRLALLGGSRLRSHRPCILISTSTGDKHNHSTLISSIQSIEFINKIPKLFCRYRTFFFAGMIFLPYIFSVEEIDEGVSVGLPESRSIH